jgi:hypothetical protein
MALFTVRFTTFVNGIENMSFMTSRLILFNVVLLFFGFARANQQISCDIRHWGNGKVRMDVKNQVYVLTEDPPQDDIPPDHDWLLAKIKTTVGPVTVIYANNSFRLQYELKLGTQSAVVIAEGDHQANLTVFLGPRVGDNNGLNVKCHLLVLK